MTTPEPTISNPNAAAADRVRILMEREDADVRAIKPEIRVKKIPFKDPDAEFDRLVSTVRMQFTDVNATLMEKRGRRFEQVNYPTFKKLMEAKHVRRRVLDQLSASHLRELNDRLRSYVKGDKELREARAVGKARVDRLIESGALSKKTRESDFYMGLYADEVAANSGTRNVFPLQDTILPTLNSPQSKQQLFVDYLDMHRKAWEAATRNPIGKRICDIIPQFVLGRGMTADIESPIHQDAWDEFYLLNRMRGRYRLLLKELLIYGEIFLRYFKTRKGLELRSIDPSTIWDIVTNPLDNEDVYYYHQQYSVMNVSPVPFYSAVYPAQLIIRQIPASDIDHYKINHVSSEKRGRSQLYSILGWLLRFKEFANDRVLLNKMRAMFALDVSVEGTAEEVSSAEQQFNVPPGSGAVLVHNKTVEVEYKNANNNANEAKTDAEMILKIIAIGAGVSEQFLGVSGASTRAGALIQTEPDVKNFETYQEILEDIAEDQWVRVQAAKRLPKTKKRMEFVFPGLAAEDRSTKLKDIAFSESMDYFSKERSATMAAREFGISNYDYDTEQASIRQERENDPVISATLQQAAKIAPDPLAGAEDPGLGSDLADGAGEAPKPALPEGFSDTGPKVTQTSGQMGFSAKRLSGRNPANTKATLDRSSFTKSGERARVKTNRTSGTPLRAAGAGRPRHVWNDKARKQALATRRANAARRASALMAHASKRPADDIAEIAVVDRETGEPVE